MTSHIPAWLKHAVLYQIYPQSFSDSNSDGIGDLQGVIDRLDYIESLGVDVIWLNPFFDSPFNDAGYDVRDYYKVAPRYGTNEDFQWLCEAAHARGMKVIFDLVIGHCSWENEWFIASGQAEPNEYSDWFIWSTTFMSREPERLQIIRGYLPRMGGYVANFFVSQPAFNFGFAHPDPRKPWQQSVHAPGPMRVRQEVKNIVKFWLDLGADGFRADMALSLVKEDYDGDFTGEIWAEIHDWMAEEYPEAVIIAEGGNPTVSVGKGKFHADFCLPFAMPGYSTLFRRNFGWGPKSYDFNVFGPEGHGNIAQFFDEFTRHYKGMNGNGYMSIPVGNHDQSPRISTGRSEDAVMMAFLFTFTMPGVPNVYYGDEIGMRSVESAPIKEGSMMRAMVRTPMQWDDSKNAGFSSAEAEALYLPIDPEEVRPTVAAQEENPNSMLNRMRALIKLKKEHKALDADADYQFIYPGADLYPIVYRRWKGDESLLIAINPTAKVQSMVVEWDAPAVECLFGQSDGVQQVDETHWKVVLPPETGGVYRKL
ncbi:MAG: alpha-amylase family glycosyl hydrolase [Anaerolineae bacterium]|jgi:maltose alpha-D-glucosyltransferase/alpha-amylase|nr:alpha-amylase family glycosyl hydrolase [Anaerolineae bacterium]